MRGFPPSHVSLVDAEGVLFQALFSKYGHYIFTNIDLGSIYIFRSVLCLTSDVDLGLISPCLPFTKEYLTSVDGCEEPQITIEDNILWQTNVIYSPRCFSMNWRELKKHRTHFT